MNIEPTKAAVPLRWLMPNPKARFHLRKDHRWGKTLKVLLAPTPFGPRIVLGWSVRCGASVLECASPLTL